MERRGFSFHLIWSCPGTCSAPSERKGTVPFVVPGTHLYLHLTQRFPNIPHKTLWETRLGNAVEAKGECGFQTLKRRLRGITEESFKVRRHKSAFWRVQLSIPDSLRDWINSCPLEFQDKSLKWAVGLQLANVTVYLDFLKLLLHRLHKKTYETPQTFIFSTALRTYLAYASSGNFSSDVSLWAWVSNFWKRKRK